ncbi:MAG: hypothetical protein LWY06_08645 [Firmicutes bacterium]|nr:hypothetical protein [Bacillota bacterium]
MTDINNGFDNKSNERTAKQTRKKKLPDFSHLFKDNETRIHLRKYYGKVCGRCGGMCCSYNISPVDFRFSLLHNMENDNIIIVRKAMILCRDFKERFIRNVKRSLAAHASKGFGTGLANLVEKHGYSLKSIIKAYMIINSEIEAHNNKVLAADKYDSGFQAIRDCFFMIPGYGCIFEEYRPFTCVTAFRKCFRELNLFDFVDAKINEAEAGDLFDFIKHDLMLSITVKPTIIINAGSELKEKLFELYPSRKPGYFEKLTYFQLAKLADFITYPFYPQPECLQGLINENIYYFIGRVKDAPPFTFVDTLEKGEPNSNFEFGLDYVRAFRISDNR